jgi:hypothetical protein
MGIRECFAGGKHELSDHEKFVARQEATKHAAREERKRLNQILNHPRVQSGHLYKLGCFLALETNMPADEACATLDAAHPGNETAHAGGSQAAERAATQHPADHDAWRQSIQAQNDLAYEAEVTRRGGRAQDNRSERDKQKSEDFLNIARRCRSDENEDDTDQLKSMGFGGGAQLEQSAYAAGAASAARLLGKSPSGSAHYPAITASRGADTPPMRERQSAAATVAPAGDPYATGRASALKLLGDTSAVRAEADNDLRERFAMQQRARASN